MLRDYFIAGGWGMYPTVVFGFVLLASAALYAIRVEERYARASLLFALVTVWSGWLGCATGVVTTIRAVLGQVPPPQQFAVWIEGCEESLHNLVLALIIVIPSALVASVGVFRKQAPPRVTTGE